MALSNTERQNRWLEKNRALHNFRRRKKNLRRDAESKVCTGMPERENDRSTVPDTVGELPTPATNQKQNTIQALRELITKESEKPVETPVAVPAVFKDDYGRAISESQWKRLQGRKEKAKAGGWEIDDYSQ